VSRYGNEAAPLLLEAAKQLEPLDLSLARRAYLTAWNAAINAHHLGGADVLLDVCRAVRALDTRSPSLASSARRLPSCNCRWRTCCGGVGTLAG
jgi:hypothetical protein